MGVSNYNNFSLVAGFMLGVVVSILRFDDIVLMVSSSILISVITYSLAVFASSYFVRYYQFEKMLFAKNEYEDILNHFRGEIDNSDSTMKNIELAYSDIVIDDEDEPKQ